MINKLFGIFNNNKIKIFLVIFITLFSVKSFSRQVFLGNTPRINPLFMANLKNMPYTIAHLPSNMLARFKDKNAGKSMAGVHQVPQAPDLSFKEIAKGVNAAEDPSTGQGYIQMLQGTKYKIVGYVTVNGQVIPKIVIVP